MCLVTDWKTDTCAKWQEHVSLREKGLHAEPFFFFLYVWVAHERGNGALVSGQLASEADLLTTCNLRQSRVGTDEKRRASCGHQE